MSPHPVRYKGDDYATAEALLQSLRFEDPEIQNAIWEPVSPMKAKMVAKAHRHAMVVEPRGERDVQNMALVLILKIRQHSEIRRALLKTGDAEIIEDCTQRKSKSGLFWGAAFVDGKWTGENTLGQLWMDLRDDIRNGEW